MLALVVFLNGMAVMVLEMVGARLLAPWLGTSVVVWTSLIGVILACLSLGYWLGGRLADSYLRPAAAPKPEKKSGKSRRASSKADKAETANAADDTDDIAAAGVRAANIRAVAVLSNLLMGASVTVFITAMLQGVMLPALSKAVPSLHLAAVLAALLLFALPSMLCGMVSPYAVRLAITDSETSGAVIGRLNAVSTVGSIVGTFLGGFVLISWFGSMETTLGVSAILLATAALVRLKPALSKAALALCLILAAFAHKSYTAYMIEAQSAPMTVDTLYSSVRVADGLMEGRPAKLLFTDPGSCQSAYFLDAPTELLAAYTKFYALGTSMNPKAKRILMLGGGGYSVPKWLLANQSELAPDFSLDVVELDPGVTELAQKYFKVPADDPRMRIFHEDARVFVNRAADALSAGAAGPYDLIFADIFNSYYTVPFHVGTVEAAQNIRALLAEDGIYIMNIITAVNGDNGRLLRSIRNAFAEVFGEVHLFPVQSAHNGTLVQNVMLLAFRTPRPLPDAAKPGLSPHIASMLSHRWTSPLPSPEKDVPPLRDNFAPVERYTLGFH